MNHSRNRITGSIALSLTGLMLALTACTGQSNADEPSTEQQEALDAPGPGLSRVIMLGDSIAIGEALPLGAAFGAADVEFHSMASEGGGNVVGPTSEARWETLPDEIASTEPSTFIYQITTYDWGSEQEQRDAYERLLETVSGVGAELVFVTSPPIEPDEFYEPHMAELDRAADVARAVAEDSDGAAVMFDAAAVWGDEYQQTRDGKADRNPDGVHTCPQGAARFTQWLLDELAGLYPDFTPPAPEEWANTGWSADDHFGSC